MKRKFRFETHWLSPFIPEVEQLEYLPRKKKKQLKKYISLKLIELIDELVKKDKL